MKSYHFRTLRYVHDVSTGEFVNIGVVMWIPEYSQLIYRLNNRTKRLSRFFTNFNGDSYRQMVRNLQRSFKEVAEDLQIPDLYKDTPENTSEMFNEFLQEDASCFQWSQIMSGISTNPEDRLEQLFEEFVTFHESPGHFRPPRPRSETMIWKTVEHALKENYLENRIDLDFTMKSASFDHSFKMGWTNGIRQVLGPISVLPSEI